MNQEPTVHLVDDDGAVLRAVSRLLRSEGFRVEQYASAGQFLERHDPSMPGCLVLDLAMPGLDGVQLQRALRESGGTLPIMFLTGRADVPTSVRVMKDGASDLLTKPCDDATLIAAVRRAIEHDSAARQGRASLAAIERAFQTLTTRERQVLKAVASGLLNKQSAASLGITEKTIKVHRARVMTKMGAGSLAELVRMADRLGLFGTAAVAPALAQSPIPLPAAMR
ncbi:MAG: response regulator transcription factor [Phycisphaerae bacterium]|nr:response regulator transcription factor [Phycisphaerae bacterium]